MSNVMSLKTIKNKPHRSAFDLSQRRCFTAKVGELLPVMCKEVIPGDKFKLGLSSFTRTRPVNSAAYTRIKEYYDYFFVPYRLLWRYFDQFITQTSASNAQFASSITENLNKVPQRSPFFRANEVVQVLNSLNSKKNEFGFNRGILAYKLLKYLGYGLFEVNRDETNGNPTDYTYNNTQSGIAVNLNAFPLLAYQKICQDYFRNTQWENSNPSLYNVDYLSASDTGLPLRFLLSSKNRTMFDVNYCNWNKDLFTGVMPSPQYGETATIGNGVINPTVNLRSTDATGSFRAAEATADKLKQDTTQPYVSLSDFQVTDADFQLDGEFQSNSSLISGFNILALRQAEALQKWREISLSGKQDYKDQIEKHFGVHVPEVRSNLCHWIGGSSSVLDIGEVVNTNLQGIGDKDSKVQADIAGRGVGNVSGSESFTAVEHGVLMCIYHAVPLMDYADTVTDLFTLKGSVYDYAIPEFDSVGMQSLPGIALNPLFTELGSPVNSDSTAMTSDYYNSLGYVPRYVDYKTSVDVVLGDFNDTLKYWAAPMSTAYFEKIAYSSGRILANPFFKCNPSLLDTIFLKNADGDYRSDNLLVNCFQDIKAVRNLDYDGLPY